MNIERDLQLICVTYNREACLKDTFKGLLADDSPVRNCDFLVLDNASTDGTAQLVAEVAAQHSNVRTIRNHHNVGGNANIAHAIEYANHKYVWILGDDDYFDFSNWKEVVAAMERDEKVILLSRYILPDEHKDDVAWQLVQATFITGVIVSTSLYTDSVVTEVYNHTHTLFPQIVPIIQLVNQGGRVHVLSKPVAFNGDDGTRENHKDLSYTRGQNIQEVSPYTCYMRWENGWAKACALIKDKALRESAVARGVQFVFGTTEKALEIFENARRVNGDVMVPLISYIAVQSTGDFKRLAFHSLRYMGDDGNGRGRIADAKEWYRHAGMNDLALGDAFKICVWHLLKILNPFSSLHRRQRGQ